MAKLVRIPPNMTEAQLKCQGWKAPSVVLALLLFPG